MIRAYFKRKIKTIEEAEDFYRNLSKDNLLFHPDDKADQIVNRNDLRIFTDQEALLIDQRVDETYKVMKDPCDFIIKNLYK